MERKSLPACWYSSAAISKSGRHFRNPVFILEILKYKTRINTMQNGEDNSHGICQLPKGWISQLQAKH